MNKVFLIGRLVKDPDLRYNQNNVAVCRFTLAIDRPKQKDKEDSGADFPSCVCFGKLAETLVKYQGKGSLIAIVGRIQTGSYENNGKKVYTTDVVVEEVKFVGTKNSQNKEKTTSNEPSAEQSQKEPNYEQLGAKTVMNEEYNPEFQITDDDLPF